MNIKFPPVKVTSTDDGKVLPEDVVSVEDAKEISDRITSALARCSDPSGLAILTDGLVTMYQEFGLSPAQTLTVLTDAVVQYSQGKLKVQLVKTADLEQHQRLARIRPHRRRHT